MSERVYKEVSWRAFVIFRGQEAIDRAAWRGGVRRKGRGEARACWVEQRGPRELPVPAWAGLIPLPDLPTWPSLRAICVLGAPSRSPPSSPSIPRHHVESLPARAQKGALQSPYEMRVMLIPPCSNPHSLWTRSSSSTSKEAAKLAGRCAGTTCS